MIIEYHRPKDEVQAIELLSRKSPHTLPLGGGTVISKTAEPVAVVDLQSLGLDYIHEDKGQFSIGSMTTLDELLTYFGSDSALGQAIRIEAGKNIRNMATLGGTLVTNGGRSPLLTVLIALNVDVDWKPGNQAVKIDTWLANRGSSKYGKYISQVRMPKVVKSLFESVGRSPLDRPVICCAASLLADGSIRIALGGFGKVPVLAYEEDARGEFGKAVEVCLADSGDEWASAAYRSEVGVKLAHRLVTSLTDGK